MDQVTSPVMPVPAPAPPVQASQTKKKGLKIALLGGLAILVIVFVIIFGRGTLFRGLLVFLPELDTQEECMAVGGFFFPESNPEERCIDSASIIYDSDCNSLGGTWDSSATVGQQCSPPTPAEPEPEIPAEISAAQSACESAGGAYASGDPETCFFAERGVTRYWNGTSFVSALAPPPEPEPENFSLYTDQRSCHTNGGLWFNNHCYDAANVSNACAEGGGIYDPRGGNYCEMQGPYHGVAYVLEGNASTGFTLIIDPEITCTEIFGGPFTPTTPPTCVGSDGETHIWQGNGYLEACGGEGPEEDYTCEEWSACTADPRGDLIQTRTCSRISTGACAEVSGIPEIKRMCEEPTSGTTTSTTPSEPSDLESRLAGLQQSQAAAAAQGQDISVLQGQISALQQQIASLQSQQQQPTQVIVQVPSAPSPAPATAAPPVSCPSGFTFDATRNACVATEVTVGVEPTEVTQGVGIVQEEETIATLQAEEIGAAEVSVAEASAPTTATAVGVAAQSATPRAETLHGAYIQGRTGPALLIYPALLGAANALWYLRKRRARRTK